MNEAERAERAVRYRSLMEDGELGEAFDAIEASYTKELVDCRDAEGRERLWLAVQVTRQVRTHFAQACNLKRLDRHDSTEIKRLAR